MEYKIISPAHFNFISLSIYAFLSSFGSLIALFSDTCILILVFFLLDTLILVFLTFRMTSVFFNREALLRKFKKQILKQAEEYTETKDKELFEDIRGKMNSLYVNTYKMAGEKDFKQVVNVNIELVVALMEQLDGKNNNELARLYYSTLVRIFMIFKEDSNYFLGVIHDKYRPFEENEEMTQTGIVPLSKGTRGMMQNALYNLFDVMLRNNQYRVAYDYWIIKLYEKLEYNFWYYYRQKDTTVLITMEDYIAYQGEELFVSFDDEKKELSYWEDFDKKLALAEEKYITFSRLIYENNEHLFVELVRTHKMPLEIMNKLSLLQMISQSGHTRETEDLLRQYLDRQYVFPIEEFARHIEQYNYRIVPEFMPKAFIEPEEIAQERLQRQLEGFYEINTFFVEVLEKCIKEYRSEWMIWTVLDYIGYTICEVKGILRQKDRPELSFLLEADINKKMSENAYLSGTEQFKRCLSEIKKELYYGNTKAIKEELLLLCKKQKRIGEYAICHSMSNPFEVEKRYDKEKELIEEWEDTF